MKVINAMEIQQVAGGKNNFDVIDFASTYIGINTMTTTVTKVFFTTQSTVMIVIPTIVVTSIVGAYLGYQAGQYIRAHL